MCKRGGNTLQNHFLIQHSDGPKANQDSNSKFGWILYARPAGQAEGSRGKDGWK